MNASDVERLAKLGEANGPNEDEALALLRAARTSPLEARAIDRLLHVGASRPLPERVMAAVAVALVDRGESPRALDLLAHAASAPSLVLRADLEADAGRIDDAIASVERALSRDIDVTGGRERWRRFRARSNAASSTSTSEASNLSLSSIDAAARTVVVAGREGPYRVVRELGRGGAGVVFEAKDEALDRSVALKMYHRPSHAAGQLLHEARVGTMLAGPGALFVYDVDPYAGWIALELAPGGSLRDALHATKVAAFAELDRWVPSVLVGLARVHREGWVHGDVKPSNVLFNASGDALLADFGSARRIGEDACAFTAAYVSPERFAGRASDPRDDVFAFGRVLDDVLRAVESPLPRWQAVMAACVGHDATRPRDGAALYALATR